MVTADVRCRTDLGLGPCYKPAMGHCQHGEEPVEERSREHRQYPRSDAMLVVSYCVKESSTGYDISHSKNVSKGGMLLTTNVAFDRGTRLDLTIRATSSPKADECTGEVIESRELVKDLAYDTHLRFLEA